MNPEPRPFAVRRILVALDASSHSLAALEAAAELASRLQAELRGLFVEDINLVRRAAWPGARRIRYPSAVEEPLDTASLERELKVQAEAARKALETVAKRARTAWSFRVVRGKVHSEILAAAAEADLLTLGRAGWSLLGGQRLGSTAAAMAAANAPSALLFVQQHAAHSARVMTVYDASPETEQALAAALEIAQACQRSLTVFVVAEAAEAAHSLQQQIHQQAGKRLVTVRCRELPDARLGRLERAVQLEGGGLLVLDARSVLAEENLLETLLRETQSSVLLVR